LPLPLNHYLPKNIVSNNLREKYASASSFRRGHVALFTGCASEVVDSKTIKDSLYILQHILQHCGCGSTLAEYDHPLSDNIIDISDFTAPFLAKLSFEPLNASAWLHTPCTFKNAPSKSTDISILLTHIGKLTINSFAAEQACCGAAGSYMLNHKKTANTLASKALAPVKQQPTDYLLTSNIGCALHLRAG